MFLYEDSQDCTHLAMLHWLCSRKLFVTSFVEDHNSVPLGMAFSKRWRKDNLIGMETTIPFFGGRVTLTNNVLDAFTLILYSYFLPMFILKGNG